MFDHSVDWRGRSNDLDLLLVTPAAHAGLHLSLEVKPDVTAWGLDRVKIFTAALSNFVWWTVNSQRSLFLVPRRDITRVDDIARV